MSTSTQAGPTTPGAVRRVPLPLVARELTVRGVEDLAPAMRRVHLAGPDLEGFAAHGPADHVKVFFPTDDGALRLPTVRDGRWLDHGAPGLVHRDYTVRTFAPDDGALVLDMVVHGHGPAGRWAGRARTGDRLGVLGPRGSMIPPLDRAWYLLAADETGLPALLNWLDRLPPTADVTALVEVGSPADHVDLPGAARVDVTWLHREGREPGSTGLLVDAAALALDRMGLRRVGHGPRLVTGPDVAVTPGDGVTGTGTQTPAAPGTVPDLWAWAAAETSAVRGIRTELTARGLGRDAFAMTGYWRRGTANFDHHSPDA